MYSSSPSLGFLLLFPLHISLCFLDIFTYVNACPVLDPRDTPLSRDDRINQSNVSGPPEMFVDDLKLAVEETLLAWLTAVPPDVHSQLHSWPNAAVSHVGRWTLALGQVP